MTTQTTTARTDEFPMSRTAIWLMCLLLSPLWGAILYYAWRKKDPAAARYANRVSWVSALFWLGLYLLYKLVLVRS